MMFSEGCQEGNANKFWTVNCCDEINEYTYELYDDKIDIQEETIDFERGEGLEGGINKQHFYTVGSMAQLKHPNHYWPK
eukprot:CAMPEP_0170557484 /NCGR_PEP_ID=MMETSP0211-20121228/26434_1 /TAXON_ID=311385 /ORGANISM="Pseudokeronopsis sp., Strain OXSARD2" /LENGTH=78 /DNA_ID=CAMNT_0010868563 /DNA_START=659 /DNA_END=895 /DNA_ORIENTATION=+